MESLFTLRRFIMGSLYEKRSSALGFTLIEIVMVLVLLGILSAVAVPKYFDLQEEAQAKACQHNRGTALSAIHMQLAAAKIAADPNLFDDTSEAKATSSAQAVIDELATDQHPLCPNGGQFTAKALMSPDGNYEYQVSCSLHTADSTNGSDSADSTITRNHADALIDWFMKNFSLPDGQGWTNANYKDASDLSHFFSSTGISTEIDSEAVVNKNSMAATVAAALRTSGMDTSRIIWRLNKENWSYSCKGVNCSGTVVLTIADKSDVTEANNNQQISATQYKMKATFDTQGRLTLSVSDAQSTTAQLIKKNSNRYWALKP